MVKFCFIQTRQSSARSAPSSNALAEFGSARRVWLWFRSEKLSFPLQQNPSGRPCPIRWVAATYTSIHHILTNPVYAGAYTYGKTKYERYVDEHGVVKKTDASSAHGAVGCSYR